MKKKNEKSITRYLIHVRYQNHWNFIGDLMTVFCLVGLVASLFNPEMGLGISALDIIWLLIQAYAYWISPNSFYKKSKRRMK